MGVDQSVLLLKSGNDIEQSSVFKELEKFDYHDVYNNHYGRGYDTSYFTDFRNSDAGIITNAKKESFGEFDIQEKANEESILLLFRALHSNLPTVL